MSSSHDSAEGGAVTGQRTLFGEWGRRRACAGRRRVGKKVGT